MIFLAVMGPPPPPVWSGQIGASYVANSGNTNNSTIGGSGELVWQPGPYRVLLAGEFVRTKNNDELGSKRISGTARLEHTLPLRFSLYGASTFFQDVPAGTRRQLAVNLGGLRHLLTGEHRSLSVAVSVARTQERRVVAPNRNFFGAEFGIEGAIKPSAGVVVEQKSSWVRDFSDPTNWRLRTATSLTAALNRHLAFKFTHQLYRNKPDLGKHAADQTVLASLVINWPPKAAQ